MQVAEWVSDPMDNTRRGRQTATMARSTSGKTVFRHRDRTPARTLFRRIVLINGAVFTLGTLVLALSPATVSARVRLTEVPVLLIGLAVMLTANAVLLRSSLAPLDGLTASLRRVDPLERNGRLDAPPSGDLSTVISAFNGMVDRLETERSAASASALAAQEGERQRIARELHDEIGQSLTVVLLSLKQVADNAEPATAQRVRAVQETVRGCLDEVRGIARRLRPGVLEDLGLASALAALCGEFADSTGIEVARAVDRPVAPLPADVELVCYRVAQESLTNIARHAGATEVRLGLRDDGDRIELSVGDDGRGGVRTAGAGIRGMRERALLVDATLTVTSPTGGGTTVRLSVPCPDRREAL